MALTPAEKLVNGFVRESLALSCTTATAGAKWVEGFMRDPDGRLVVVNG